MATAHRTQVLTIGPATCTPVCSCGWVGPDKRDKAEASVLANKHKVDGMRQNIADPNQLDLVNETNKKKS